MSKVRVRYAPSPTGVMHIGGVRTALFNFLFARSQKGDFILRIEDTDRKRLVSDSLQKIKESLELLSLKWDEYYVQSERLQIYQKHLDHLKEKGKVYEDEGAWRFRVEKGKKLEWHDGVHDKVQFASDVIEDFIIVKSDKFPTYHFANVVDDTMMKISHVLRGDEWLSSTPKHLMLYEAFGWQPPIFIHVPVILGTDHKKLSKREGAKSVLEYMQEGYLPEALVNYLSLLGWAPKGDKELFTLDELTSEFSLDRLNKNSPIFSMDKLNWFNGQWIRRLDKNDYIKRLKTFYPKYDSDVTANVAPLTQDRVSTLAEYKTIADFFYQSPQKIPVVPTPQKTISSLINQFETIKTWETDTIKDLIEKCANAEKVDRVELITSVRNIVSAQTVTPPLYESLEKLGREETLKRLYYYLKKAKQAKS